MKFFGAIFFSLVVAAASDSSADVRRLQAETACTNGKEFTECGSACPPTCDTVGEPIFCITVCVPGCFCPAGTVDSGTGCVKPEDCVVSIDITCANVLCSTDTTCIETPTGPECVPVEEQCTDDKVYNECGSACPATCDTIGGEPIPCIALCVPGCFCPAGTVESGTGCVKPEDCVISIDITCANVLCSSDTTCIETPTGPQCVPVEEQCTGDKVYNACGSACPATCDTIGEIIPCPAVCVPGCFCPAGTVESGEGCVKPEDCPAEECTDGKVYNDCGSACPATCDTIGELIPCIALCVPGCFCPAGTVASGEGCVKPEDCPAETCTDGKVYNECGSACPATCDNVDAPFFCIDLCVPGCFCPIGTVASGEECVNPEDCPPSPGDYTAWYEDLKKTYTGSSPLKKCIKVQRGIRPIPKTGDRCSRKKKTCFFGTQACGVSAYPQTQCDCVDKQWSCTDAVACP